MQKSKRRVPAPGASHPPGQVCNLSAACKPCSQQSPNADGSRSPLSLRARGACQSPTFELQRESPPLLPNHFHLPMACALQNTLNTPPAAPGCLTSATDFIVNELTTPASQDRGWMVHEYISVVVTQTKICTAFVQRKK